MQQKPRPSLCWAPPLPLPPTLGTSLGFWHGHHHLGWQGRRAGGSQGCWGTTGASQAEGFWLQGGLAAMRQAQVTPQEVSPQRAASVTGSTYQGIYLLGDILPRGRLQAGRQAGRRKGRVRKRQVREKEREIERDMHTEQGPGSKVPPWLFLALPRKRTVVPFPSLPANTSALPKGRESLETQARSWGDAWAPRGLPSRLPAATPHAGPLPWTGSTQPNPEPAPQWVPAAPHTFRIPSGSSRVRPHRQEVNNGASPARSHTQPGCGPPAGPEP